METPLSLLFIDDGSDPATSEIKKGLEDPKGGINPDFTGSGNEALSFAEKCRYDLVVWIYGEGEEGETKFLERLKEKIGDTPVIIVADPRYEKNIFKSLYGGLEFSLLSPGDPGLVLKKIKAKIKAVADREAGHENTNESDRIIREIINSAENVGIITTDENKIISFFSRGAEKMLGYNHEEVEGIETPAIFHIEEEIAVKAKELSEKTGKTIEGIDLFAEKITREGPERYEWTYRRKDGGLISVDLTITLIRDHDGKIFGAFGIFTDITDKKRLEEEYNSYKIQSSGIISHIPEPTFAIDLEGRVIAWNLAMEKVTDIPAQDILGKGDYEYSVPFFGKRRPMLIDMVNKSEESMKEWKYENITKSGSVISIDDESLEIKGKTYFVRASASPVYDRDGRIIGAIESVSDLTKLKKAEKALAREKANVEYIIDSLPGMFYIFSEEGRFVRWNKNLETITGYSGEEIEKIDPLNLVWERYREELSDGIEKAFLEGYSERETVIVTKCGRRIPFLFSAYRKSIDGVPLLIGLGLDITQTKAVEKEIRKLALIVRHSREFIATADREGRGTFINEAGAEMIGIDKDKVSSYKLEEIFTDDVREKAVAEIIPSLMNKGSWEGDLVYRNFSNDDLIDVHAMTFAITDPETDEPEFLVNVSLDITERKKAEKALAREKANVEYIIDSLPGMFYMFYMFDQKGRFVRWNKNLETLTGYSTEEVSRMRPLEFIESNYREETTEAIRKAFTEGYSDIEAPIITKDGEKIPFFFSANREYIDGKSYILGMGLDITKSKNTEDEIRKLASVVRHSGEMVLLTDPEGVINFINEAGVKMIGVDAGDIGGYRFMDFIPGHLKEKVNTAILPALSGEGLWEGDLQYLNKKTGEIVDVHAMTFTINDPETGDPDYLASVSLNITERKKAEAALKEVNKKLNLLGSITRHDILNQVTVALGYLDIMEMDGSNAFGSGSEEYYSKILEAVKTIERQILFTKDYKDLGEQAPEWFDVRRLIENNYNYQAFRSVHLENETDGLEIYADPLFAKVIYNLFDNAVKHGDKITTIRFRFERSGDDLDLICEDDGVGIPAEFKEKIFKREYYKHTGLGLFLSREILSITGMQISETGEYGKGARFVIHVPKGLYRFDEPV